MSLLSNVYQNYAQTLGIYPKVDSSNRTPDEKAIRLDLPAFFRGELNRLGREEENYKIYGGIGQLNFNRALIPWVAICDREITTTTNRGYYVVLLFKQDMSGCYLSLNQGYNQFAKLYGPAGVAKRYIARSANICAQYLNLDPGPLVGPIDLGATHDMGRGYETAAIASMEFADSVSEQDLEFRNAFASLIGHYDALKNRIGKGLINALPPAAEQDFQSAAQELVNKSNRDSLPPGPMIPPPPQIGGQKGRQRRDPEMAARAIETAGHKCEMDENHRSFISKRTKKMFVEAHHLVPVSRQPEFSTRLDVPENIIALCPNCHRLIHYAKRQEIRPLLESLYQARASELLTRGISLDFPKLLNFYGEALTEDD